VTQIDQNRETLAGAQMETDQIDAAPPGARTQIGPTLVLHVDRSHSVIGLAGARVVSATKTEKDVGTEHQTVHTLIVPVKVDY